MSTAEGINPHNERRDVLDEMADRRAAELRGEAPAQPRTRLEEVEGELDRLLVVATEAAVASQEAARDRRAALAEVGGAVVDDVKAKLRDHAQALYEGDPERAAELMAEVVAHVPDAKDLADQVARELEQRKALDEFAERYPEIVANPHLAGFADKRYAAALAEGKTQVEALEAAGAATIAHLKTIAKDLGMEEDEAAVRATGGSSASAIIAEMQEARRPSSHATTER